MSTNLYFAPVRPKESEALSKGLKFLLATRYFGHDGSLSDRAMLSSRDIPFLEGIAIATADDTIRTGAQRLITALNQWDEVEIFLEG